jgi:D-amino peptidase
MRIFISADMEGVAGIATGEQLGPGGFEYERGRELMTAEVLAAIEGARAGGATGFVVADSHGNALNLLPDRFGDDVELVRGWPRPLHMMQGVEGGCAAAFLLGYHTAASSVDGVRAHTFSSAALTAVRLNGEPASEARVNAALAGHFGVPITLVSGDDRFAREARALFGDTVEAVTVKRALGFHSAASMAPAAAREAIRAAAARAVAAAPRVAPYRVPPPYMLELDFKHYRPAELLGYLPGVERPASRTVRFRTDDVTQLPRLLQFALNYEAGLQP